MPGQISKARSRRTRQRRANGKRARRLHGAVLGLGLLGWVATAALLLGLRPTFQANLGVGQKAPSTLVAVVDFTCTDLPRTELLRRQAAEAVFPVFSIHTGRLAEDERRLQTLFDRIAQREAAAAEEGIAPEALREAIGGDLELIGLSLAPEDALTLADPDRAGPTLDALRRVLDTVWNEGIVSPEEKETRFRGVAPAGRILVESPDETSSRSVEVAALRTPAEAAREAVRLSREAPDIPRLPAASLAAFWSAWMQPNLTYEPLVTDARRAQAEKAVAPAPMTVRAGTTLIEAGERATPQVLEMLRIHTRRLQENTSRFDYALRLAGSASLLAVGLFLCLAVLHVLTPETLRRPSRLALFVTLSLATLLLVRLAIYFSVSSRWLPPALRDFALPLSLSALLAALLVGERFATGVGLWVSLAAAVMAGNSFDILFMGLLTSGVAVLVARDARKRSRVFQAGLWIGLAKMLYVLGLDVHLQQSWSLLAAQAAAALASGFGAALLAVLLLPLFESVFGLTTDIRLLELSDPAHPLLRRLAVEAPGTYHHSLMVASIAQAAAQEIGARGLLVRVCAYYHDIGKLTKPEYFTENAQRRRNPHDGLSPSMSTLVIVSHVKEGVGLARSYKLPAPILDAIRQHHGTGVVSYFLHRARQQQQDANPRRTGAGPVREEDFRYGGPKPQSREMAVLSLADAAEAASRSLDRPTPGRIESLVEEIVRRKLEDGQLDQSALTFQDLSRIRRSLVFTLTNMLHGRVAYPKDEDRNREPATPPPGPEPGAPAPGPVDHDARSAIELAQGMG